MQAAVTPDVPTTYYSVELPWTMVVPQAAPTCLWLEETLSAVPDRRLEGSGTVPGFL